MQIHRKETIFSQGEAGEGEKKNKWRMRKRKKKNEDAYQRDKSVSDRTRGHLLVVDRIKTVGARLGWKRANYRFVWRGVLIVR